MRTLTICALSATALVTTACSSVSTNSPQDSLNPITESRWVDQAPIAPTAIATFIDTCSMGGSVCPDQVKLSVKQITVGDEIGSIRIRAIKCDLYSKDIRGWRGGPDYVAKAGAWNCIAASDRQAVETHVTENGDRLHPWVAIIATSI